MDATFPGLESERIEILAIAFVHRLFTARQHR